jgi:hypothetical protein
MERPHEIQRTSNSMRTRRFYFHVDSNIKSGTRRVVNHAEQIDLVVDDRSFKFYDDPDDDPMVGANVGVLYPATSIRGTRQRVDSGDRRTWNSTVCAESRRHKIYTGSSSQSSVPYILFGLVLRPAPRCCSPEGLGMSS